MLYFSYSVSLCGALFRGIKYRGIKKGIEYRKLGCRD
jgi:hypothetical protein